MEKCQEESAFIDSKLKIVGGMQQKNPSKLSYQDRWFSAMANDFICSLAYPTFRNFRDIPFSQMMNDIAGENILKH